METQEIQERIEKLQEGIKKELADIAKILYEIEEMKSAATGMVKGYDYPSRHQIACTKPSRCTTDHMALMALTQQLFTNQEAI